MVGITPKYLYSCSCSLSDLLCFMSVSTLRGRNCLSVLWFMWCHKRWYWSLAAKVSVWSHQCKSVYVIFIRAFPVTRFISFAQSRIVTGQWGGGICICRIRFSNSCISCKTEAILRLACYVWSSFKKKKYLPSREQWHLTFPSTVCKTNLSFTFSLLTSPLILWHGNLVLSVNVLPLPVGDNKCPWQNSTSSFFTTELLSHWLLKKQN